VPLLATIACLVQVIVQRAILNGVISRDLFARYTCLVPDIIFFAEQTQRRVQGVTHLAVINLNGLTINNLTRGKQSNLFELRSRDK
jgi:hypothetical protein